MQGIESRHPPGGVAIITGELTRYVQSMRSVMQLVVPPNSMSVWRAGVLVAENVNRAIRDVLANPDMRWVWLMGDDHTFPADIVMKLLDREVDVVAPMCLNRAPPMDPVIVQPDGNGGRRLKYLEDMPASGLYRLQPGETCGDAGLLIRRHVLEKIGDPWCARKKSGGNSGEDQDFTARIQEEGFGIHIDVDNPIGHITGTTIEPVRGDNGWEVRLVAGNRVMCQLGPVRR
jgi:hypothetical protein